MVSMSVAQKIQTVKGDEKRGRQGWERKDR